MNKKILSLCIASTMLLSALPTTVLAASVGSTDTDKNIGSDSVQNQQTQYANFHESNAETEVYLTVDDSELLVSVPSTVILDGTPDDNGQYIGKYSVGVKGDMAGNKVVIVEPDTNVVSLRQDGKINNDATISQTQTDFNTDDFRDETVTDGTITATGLTAGSWNSEFNFNISISKDGLPAGYTTLYEYDLSATENDDVKAYYAVPIKNTAPIDSSTPSLFSTRALSNENVIEYNGVRYELSDEDTLVITGEGNMTENLISKLYGYQEIMDAVETKFGFKCSTYSTYEEESLAGTNEGQILCLFKQNSIYPSFYFIKENGKYRKLTINEQPSGVREYINSIKNNKKITLPKNVIVKDGVTNISKNAFKSCKNLVNVTMPESVTTIDEYAFYDCANLVNITIPKSVTTIGNRSFQNCVSLTDITIPNNITNFGTYVFSGCKNLKSAMIQEGEKIIGSHAFQGCSNLTNLIIPESVTTIGEYAFYECASLTNIVIPKGVTSIKESTFRGCSGLTSITIPDSVINFGSSAFTDCNNLNKTNYTGTVAQWCKLNFYEIDSNPIYFSKNLYINDELLENLKIENGTNKIGNKVFYGCESLKSVEIPNSVTTIETSAFSGCKNLRKIIMGEGITNIGNAAFGNCTSLTDLVIPNSVTAIGAYLFQNCSSLTSITIPNNITNIGFGAFRDCTSLTSITIPDSVTSISGNAFNNLASGSTIYCQSQDVADLVAGKYTASRTTVVVDASKFE